MKKEKADLEQLLNSLIQRGRVPFGDEKIHSFEIIYVTGKIRNIVAKRGRGQVNMHYSIRDVLSKESNLWQYVCENGMIKRQIEETLIEFYDNLRGRTEIVYDDTVYQYRLIESSLKDESELEDFLLSNIKVDAND